MTIEKNSKETHFFNMGDKKNDHTYAELAKLAVENYELKPEHPLTYAEVAKREIEKFEQETE